MAQAHGGDTWRCGDTSPGTEVIRCESKVTPNDIYGTAVSSHLRTALTLTALLPFAALWPPSSGGEQMHVVLLQPAQLTPASGRSWQLFTQGCHRARA